GSIGSSSWNTPRGEEMDAQAISSTIEKFRANPDAARSSPAVTGRLVEGRAELAAGSYTWHADLAPALGGSNAAPSPTDLPGDREAKWDRDHVLGGRNGGRSLGLRQRHVDDVLSQEPDLQLVAAQDIAHEQIVRAHVPALLGLLDRLADLLD